jgi:DNA repair exonuclease SbcCD ATPase subunit
MLKLLNLKFKNIGRFKELQEIDFTIKGNVILVDGKNLQTGGSSGSGKSTIFHSIDYLFGINEIPANALQSRLTKNAIWVQGLFDKNGELYRISRGKKEGLVIEKQIGSDFESLVSGNNKISEEKLAQILELPKELVKRLIHKRQKEGGFFLNLTPKEVYNFLVECLNLDTNSKKLQDLVAQNKELVKQVEVAKNSLLILSSNSTTLKGLLDTKIKPELLILENGDILKQQLSLLQDKFKQIKSLCLNKVSEIETPTEMAANYPQDRLNSLKSSKNDLSIAYRAMMSEKAAKLSTYNKALNQIMLEINSINMLSSQVDFKKTHLGKIENDLALLVGHLCPECGQKVPDTSLFDAKNKLKLSLSNEIAELEAKINLSSSLYDKRNRLQEIIDKEKVSESATSNMLEEIKEVEAQIDEENKKKSQLELEVNRKNIALWNDYNNRVSTLKATFDSQSEQILSRINEQSAHIQKIEQEQRSYDTRLKSYCSEVSEITGRLNKIELEKKELEIGLTQLDKKAIIINEAIRLIKAYSLHVFEESLAYISKIASEFLNEIPNMRNAYVYFETKYENSSGEIKDEINAYINLESDEKVPVKSLSGGERTAVDLAVDLAVNRMLEEYSGKGFGWIQFDEPFQALDAIGQEACLELLNTVNHGKQILLIEHATELKSSIKDIITIKRDGEVSEICE